MYVDLLACKKYGKRYGMNEEGSIRIGRVYILLAVSKLPIVEQEVWGEKREEECGEMEGKVWIGKAVRVLSKN